MNKKEKKRAASLALAGGLLTGAGATGFGAINYGTMADQNIKRSLDLAIEAKKELKELNTEIEAGYQLRRSPTHLLNKSLEHENNFRRQKYLLDEQKGAMADFEREWKDKRWDNTDKYKRMSKEHSKRVNNTERGMNESSRRRDMLRKKAKHIKARNAPELSMQEDLIKTYRTAYEDVLREGKDNKALLAPIRAKAKKLKLKSKTLAAAAILPMIYAGSTFFGSKND